MHVIGRSLSRCLICFSYSHATISQVGHVSRAQADPDADDHSLDLRHLYMVCFCDQNYECESSRLQQESLIEGLSDGHLLMYGHQSLRRATPDSEAVASSEDERPWPAAKSFGSLPRGETNVPGLGGTIWSTQKRDSFKMEKAAQRNAAREARLAAPNGNRSILRPEGTPSPAVSDASGALPFAIPLQPVLKAGRSMSHSQGQREVPVSSDRTVRSLGLLAEEADTESESELDGGLTHTMSHPPIGTLQRTSTFPSTYASFYGDVNGREGAQAAGRAQAGSRGDQRFETAFANVATGTTIFVDCWAICSQLFALFD